MSPRAVTERLIRATRTDPQTAADEYATAAALLKSSTPAAGAEVLRLLATEIADARDAAHEEQARRRHLA